MVGAETYSVSELAEIDDDLRKSMQKMKQRAFPGNKALQANDTPSSWNDLMTSLIAEHIP